MQRGSKRILTGLGVFLVLLAVTYALLLGRATLQLRRAYAALAAEGRPLRTAEIVPPAVPDSDNAAVLYRSAVLLLKGQPIGDKNLFEKLTDRRWRTERQAEIQELVGHEAVARALPLIEEGTRRPTCQIEHDNGIALTLPNAGPLDDLRELASILTSRAKFEARAGRPARAWDLLVTQLRLADSLRSDPAPAAQSTRMAITRWAARTIQWLCESARPEPGQRQALDALLQRQEDVEPLVRAIDGQRLLIGERFFNLPRNELDKILWQEKNQYKDPISPGLKKALHRLSFLLVAFKPRLVADHAAYLQLMRKQVQLLRGPYRDRKEANEFLRLPHLDYLAYRLSWTFGVDKWSHCELLTTVRLTRAGLALLQYKQAHGAFPETLDALGMGDWRDPYVEQPLHYQPQGEGFVIYSVGEDRHDNGGVPQRRRTDADPPRKPIEYDEVWRFPNPENQTGE